MNSRIISHNIPSTRAAHTDVESGVRSLSLVGSKRGSLRFFSEWIQSALQELIDFCEIILFSAFDCFLHQVISQDEGWVCSGIHGLESDGIVCIF